MTPMLNQYFEIKNKHKDKILLFRLGDFYEMFGEDAVKASKILDIVLTARHKGTENEIPMCGIPYHSVEQYLAKLTKAGYKAAICEQVSDPKLPGIVKREVVQIVTPGTTLNSSLLDKSENNFLASVFYKSEDVSSPIASFGLAFVDLTTGEFKAAEFNNINNLISELKRINPAEMIVDNVNDDKNANTLFSYINKSSVNDFELEKSFNNKEWKTLFKNVSKFSPSVYFEPLVFLCEHFKVKGLEGFGISNMKFGIKAAANLIYYLKDTQKTSLRHINKIALYNSYDYMALDEATIRNLDLVYNYQAKGKEGTLLSVLDKTLTAMGARLLRQWLLHPLIDLQSIEKRIKMVEYFYNHIELRQNFRELLSNILDIERILAKAGCNRVNARDLSGLKESLIIAGKIREIMQREKNGKFSDFPEDIKDWGLEEEWKNIEELINLIDKMIVDDPPISIVDGGIIKAGNDEELDELRKISSGGKEWIAELQVKERTRTGINSLKIKFNKVFGYYIEISNANINAVPADYMRKQTLVNGERFITPELKEYEEKVLQAEERIKDMEYKLFNGIVGKVTEESEKIQKLAYIIAKFDVLANFSHIALENNYIKPKYGNPPVSIINIKNGRHPVIEKMGGVEFITNDCHFAGEEHQLVLLTGPNMAGKSVYLRQNALIVLMAQLGSYVPAEAAELCIIDRIFTRVGASDNIVYGQSTFMVEMQEAANILNNATEKSLIIFDELGRGTSTYDGVSIAWAVIDYIHNKIKAKTLFATHYHELVRLADTLYRIKNYRMAVLEQDNKVIFLHKVIEGEADRSYGIEVAKLAGLPLELIEKAQKVLANLEKQKSINVQSLFEEENKNNTKSFGHKSEIEEEIKNLDLNNMTPLQAMALLQSLKDKLKK